MGRATTFPLTLIRMDRPPPTGQIVGRGGGCVGAVSSVGGRSSIRKEEEEGENVCVMIMSGKRRQHVRRTFGFFHHLSQAASPSEKCMHIRVTM